MYFYKIYIYEWKLELKQYISEENIGKYNSSYIKDMQQVKACRRAAIHYRL